MVWHRPCYIQGEQNETLFPQLHAEMVQRTEEQRKNES